MNRSEINWKEVCRSAGYISLKACYIKDLRESRMRGKDELYKHFQWVIGRAKHYSVKLGKPIQEILEDWESKRTFWWLNYYQDCRQPKTHSNSLKPIGVNGFRKRIKSSWGDAHGERNRVMIFINNVNKSTKGNPRWSARRKKRGY